MNTSTMNATSTLNPAGKFWSFAPLLSRMIMFPPILIFTLVGSRFLHDPGHAIPGATLNTPQAFTDTRVIGAWFVTLVVMIITYLSSRDRLWLGHLHLAIFIGLTLAVRIFGFMNDGTTLAMGNEARITIVETVFLVLNMLGFFMQTRLIRNSR